MIRNMSVDSPKRAVIINPFNSKLVCPLPTKSFTSILSFSEKTHIKTEPMSHKKGRKRSLDHLTFEEKLMRKKLKNREAAQTSRDRKKARMEELEKTNKELRNEVHTLRLENKEVLKENERLREELRFMNDRCTLESTPGSAESSVLPLPQGHSSHLTLATPLLIHLVFLQLMIGIGYYRIISNRISHNLMNLFKICHLYQSPIQRILKLIPTKWWGRHQRSWNPAGWNYLPLSMIY